VIGDWHRAPAAAVVDPTTHLQLRAHGLVQTLNLLKSLNQIDEVQFFSNEVLNFAEGCAMTRSRIYFLWKSPTHKGVSRGTFF
jgi:hypothetical protein